MKHLPINQIIQGDCLEELKKLSDESVDAVITDPPYELGFMGKKWDATGIAYNIDLWKECLRVLKPGGHLLSFGGTRTYHRMAVAIEDAGFEIRDMLEWIYASGFPKSQNVGKAYDKKMGNEREKVGDNPNHRGDSQYKNKYTKGLGQDGSITKGNSKWEGFGTALKPAHEPIVLARKPLSEKTIVENCIKHGTGALDIDGCRIPTKQELGRHQKPTYQYFKCSNYKNGYWDNSKGLGRFPANLLVTDDALGEKKSRYFSIDVWAEKHGLIQVPKASKRERNEGLEIVKEKNKRPQGEAFGQGSAISEHTRRRGNNHPTVKPLHLMSWLIRLVSKENDIVLDPFIGSGTTGVACKKLGRNFIGIEQDPEYVRIAEARIKAVSNQGKLELTKE